MELSKEQIKHIDHRLEQEGIIYWDIRIEMLDHTVSDIEKSASSDDFKEELYKSLLKTKWLGDLSIINRKGWQNVNKLYRRKYFLGFLDFFKKASNIFMLIVFLISYYLLSKFTTHNVFLKTSYALFASPTIVFFYLSFKTFRKKIGKSINRDYALNYLMFSFLILNAVVTFVRVDDGFPIEYHKVILFIVLPVHYVFTYSGFNVFKNAMTKVERIKTEINL